MIKLFAQQIKFISSIMILLALTFGANAKVPEIDPGGSIFERFELMKIIDRAGVEYHINGVCISACTLFLGLEKVCMEPRSLLMFHSASSPDANGNLILSEEGNMIARLVYPQRILEWIDKKKALATIKLTPMTSDEAWSLGVKKCDEQGKTN
jgi:hypothetical protein